MSNNSYLSFRVVLIGNAQVGKTSIVRRLINKEFGENYIETVGAAFFSYTYTFENQTILLQIWDTAGQEKYQSLGPIYYRNSAAAIVVFDHTDIESFHDLSNWINAFHGSASDSAKIYIVGNKNDLEDHQVTSSQAQQYAEENKYEFFSVSAKTGNNIERLFQTIAQQLISSEKERFILNPKTPVEATEMTKSKCCS